MSQCARGCKIKVVSKHSKTAAYIVSVILMNKLKLGVVLWGQCYLPPGWLAPHLVHKLFGAPCSLLLGKVTHRGSIEFTPQIPWATSKEHIRLNLFQEGHCLCRFRFNDRSVFFFVSGFRSLEPPSHPVPLFMKLLHVLLHYSHESSPCRAASYSTSFLQYFLHPSSAHVQTSSASPL